MQDKKFVIQENYVKDIQNTKQYADDFQSEIFSKTSKYQKKFNLNMTEGTVGYNDETDAFRHAFMSATMTMKGNKNLAGIIGDEHENFYQKPKNMPQSQWNKETNMDKWNNAIGRDIGLELEKELKDTKNFYTQEQIEDMMAVKIRDRLKKGDLIVGPFDDKRSFEKKLKGSPTGYAADIPMGKIFTAEEIGEMNPDEFALNEKAINKQMSGLGVPRESEAKQAVQDGSMVWVNAYKREDGTDVKGHYRAR